MPIDVMFAVLWLGMFAAGSTVLIRVLPFIVPLLDRGMKPWVCDKCMSFWLILFGSTAVPLIATEFLHYPLSYKVFLLAGPAAYALSLSMLKALTEPGPPPTFNMPELVDLSVPDLSGKTYVPPFSDPPPAH